MYEINVLNKNLADRYKQGVTIGHCTREEGELSANITALPKLLCRTILALYMHEVSDY